MRLVRRQPSCQQAPGYTLLGRGFPFSFRNHGDDCPAGDKQPNAETDRGRYEGHDNRRIK